MAVHTRVMGMEVLDVSCRSPETAFVVDLSNICSVGLYLEAQCSISSALLSFKALVRDRRDNDAALRSGGY